MIQDSSLGTVPLIEIFWTDPWSEKEEVEKLDPKTTTSPLLFMTWTESKTQVQSDIYSGKKIEYINKIKQENDEISFKY